MKSQRWRNSMIITFICVTILLVPNLGLWAKGLDINIDINVSEIFGQITNTVKSAYHKLQENQKESAKQAIPKLIVDYVQVAALLDQLADNLETERADKRKRKFAISLRISQLDELDRLMKSISSTTESIDPSWTTENVELACNKAAVCNERSNLVRETFYIFRYDLDGESFTKSEMAEVTAHLRKSAKDTRQLSKDLAATVVEANAS